MFSDFTQQETLTLAFWRTLFKGGLLKFADYDLAQGLVVHTRFDDLDFISRSLECQNDKLQIVCRFLSTVD